ncbi:MAG: response regulator [Lachnospiraceae bacterium]|nr:response regulator [Lachnospiraceae bacterium]
MKKSKSLASRIWAVVLLAVILSSGLICVVSIASARNAITSSTRQRMIDIANCASGSVNGDVLKRLTKDDKDTAGYRSIYNSLAVFRDNIESEYVYGIKEEDDGRFTFTVDPAIDDPGEFGEEVVRTDALVKASKGITAVDEQPYSDKWGSFYSAYSPVFDSDGNVAGIIGVDFSLEWYESQLKEQTRESIIMYVFILTFVLFIVGLTCYSQIKTITDPLVEITRVASKYRNGDFDEKLEIDRQDEIGVLSETLQSMATSLTQQIKVAEEANNAKSVFLANMSHEIRTPINAMLGNNEMIYRESSEALIREYSQNVKTAGDQLLVLVDEILAYSKNGEKPSEPGAAVIPGTKERFTAKDARILAVDDNPMNLRVFLNLIKRTHISVDTAESGDEGIRLASQNKYDVFVFDHMMPEKDGIETLAEIRADKEGPNADTPAICLTANAIPGAREYYIGSGFDDYLTKPVDPDALEKMLRAYIPEEKITICSADEEGESDDDLMIPDELENLRGSQINIATGIKNNGSVSSYLSLLKMFYESMDDRAQELGSLYEENDIRNYTIKVHALKSSLRIIGAEELGEEAQKLEDAGKRNDNDYIDANQEVFIRSFVNLKDVLYMMFSETEENVNDRPEADERLIRDSLDEIWSAANDMDCDRLETVFDGLRPYRIPDEYGALFAKLKTASDNYEYDRILDLLGRKR